MFASFFKLVQENQPVATTGAIAHSYYWLTSGSEDTVYHNPDFKVPETADSAFSQGIAIYCIHGTFDQSASFSRIAERLIAQGLPDFISSIHLVSFAGRYQGNGIDYFSRQLMEKIEKNGHQQVIFLGHSRGGLVASYAAEEYAGNRGINVHLVVNICSPFGGSYLAVKPLSWFSHSVLQMENNSEFLKTLNEKLAQTNRKYYFIAAKKDWIVRMIDAFSLGYVKKHPGSFLISEREHSHLSIMSSHWLVGLIRDCLFKLADIEERPLNCLH
ncbi:MULTISPECIES: alpha/beta hydrolase [unclassified Legionella]|uniref:lipase family alpha/beta hydrolase n=1 Tax=unclassified Legionella TaxID=2622702 RepID=UPI001056A59A|nr:MULTISPECIES: alpha/beta hydrolase [unclassified Legionella]MDI9819252.1 alpha/beta hydrolase [Legionella sp. PL877]